MSEMNAVAVGFVMISIVFIMILALLGADIKVVIRILASWSAHIVFF